MAFEYFVSFTSVSVDETHREGNVSVLLSSPINSMKLVRHVEDLIRIKEPYPVLSIIVNNFILLNTTENTINT